MENKYSTDLSCRSLKTPVFQTGELLKTFLIKALSEGGISASDLENSVLAVTSKLFSLAEGRLVSRDRQSKKSLILEEADHYLGELAYDSHLTIARGVLLPSAGIDESNSPDGDYILLPEYPFKSLQKLNVELREHFQLENFGLLMTDSRSAPLRNGVNGVSIAHSGFYGILDRVGEKDLFGRSLKMTKINVADALAAAAVFCLGESKEQSPIALLRSSGLRFRAPSADIEAECRIEVDNDLYRPFLLSNL